MSFAGDGGRAPRVNLVSWDSGGLGIDLDVLTRVLVGLGCEVTFKSRRWRQPRSRLHSLAASARVLAAQKLAVLANRPTFDLNLHIESVFPEYVPQARFNGLFVHPEWFREENVPRLPLVDWVLCKTPSAVDYMDGLGVVRRMVGFTSPDKRVPGAARNAPLECLHISGASFVKGSEAVVEVWGRHPEWPRLTVIRRRRYGGEEAPPLAALPNVHYETEFVPDAELTRLQNACVVHVIPSQAEGYGHIIGEGMSCGAVVVTTDAPPMNELVAPERGVLVRVARAEPMRRSMRNFVDLDDLEARLAAVFAMTATERAELGRHARAWYEAQDARFEHAMRSLLAEVMAPPAPAAGA